MSFCIFIKEIICYEQRLKCSLGDQQVLIWHWHDYHCELNCQIEFNFRRSRLIWGQSTKVKKLYKIYCCQALLGITQGPKLVLHWKIQLLDTITTHKLLLWWGYIFYHSASFNTLYSRVQNRAWCQQWPVESLHIVKNISNILHHHMLYNRQ